MHRFDHVVAVAEGIGVGEVLIQPIRVCITSHIEPVPSPPFTITRRSEQPVDESFESIFGWVLDKMRHFVRSGWQADQIECHTSDECPAIRFPRNGEPLRFEFRQNELVDGRTNPAG